MSAESHQHRPPAPVGEAPAAENQARQRHQILSRIDKLVATADDNVARLLKRGDLSDANRLCLSRVRAIITYGAHWHYKAEEQLLEQSLLRCLMLTDQHLHAVRALRRSKVDPTKTDPPEAFRAILNDDSDTRKDACKKFDNWFKMVDHAARAAPRTRTLESDAPSGGSAA